MSDSSLKTERVPRFDCAGGGAGSYCQGCYHMEEVQPTYYGGEVQEYGDYVRSADYDALRLQLAKASRVNDQLAGEYARERIQGHELRTALTAKAKYAEALENGIWRLESKRNGSCDELLDIIDKEHGK